MRYRINTPKVIHQVFGSEVVAVNLETGVYYSVRGSGVDLWRAIEAGISPQTVIKRFNGTAAPEKVSAFLNELEREQLILPISETTAEPAALPDAKAFADPVFEKFTDMREMLLIDPIHELDENGWPKRSWLRDEEK